jgi:hypothetical protein
LFLLLRILEYSLYMFLGYRYKLLCMGNTRLAQRGEFFHYYNQQVIPHRAYYVMYTSLHLESMM